MNEPETREEALSGRPDAGDSGAVETVLRELYSRHGGVRYIAGAMAVGIMLALATLAVAALWGGRYMRLSVGQLAGAWAIAALIMVPAAVLSIRRWMDILRPIMLWSERRASEHAEEAWSAAVRIPSILTARMFATVMCLAVPTVTVVVLVEDISVWTGAGILLGGLVALLAALVLIAFGADLVLRPVLEDIVPYLPARFEPAVRVPRLGLKTLVPLLPVTLFSALTVGAYVDLVGRGPLRLALAFGIALATVAVAGFMFSIVTRAVLHPMNELVAATRRVSEGDIDTPVAVVSGDELGTLASTFNRMLANLRQHERELRASQARIVAASDEARRRVERDLHDGAQQQLVLLGLKLAVIERRAKADPVAVVTSLGELRADLDRAMAELRDLAHGIYPPVLENEGLPGALREAAERAALPTEVDCDGASRYRPEIEAAVYFCCLEALQNAAKHAGERANARVRIAERDRTLEFEVTDDGRGFDPDAPSLSAGIQNIADRIGALGGKVSITSSLGAGTTVAGAVPLEPSAPSEPKGQ